MGEQTWLNPQDRHVVDLVTAVTRHRELSDGGRRALLDALGHSPDCVAPDHYRKVWQAEHERAEAAQTERDRADRAEEALDASQVMERRHRGRYERWRDRAERAERERDRLREALRRISLIGDPPHVNATCHWHAEAVDVARAALSAGADADAKPTGGPDAVEVCHCGRAEPCRHHPACDCRSRTVDEHSNVIHDVDCTAGEFPPLWSSCPRCGDRGWVKGEHPDEAARCPRCRRTEPEQCGDHGGVSNPCDGPVGHPGAHESFDDNGWRHAWPRDRRGASWPVDEQADAEPETCVCGHVRGLHSPIGGGCLPPEGCSCTAFYDRTWSAEPSRAEGDEQPKSLNDLAREWGLPPLTWVHTRFIEPHESSPDTDRVYTQPGTGRLEAPCLNCGNGEVVMAIPNHAEGGRPREADPQGASPSTGASVDGGGDDGRSRARQAAAKALREQHPDLGDSCYWDRADEYAHVSIYAALDNGEVVGVMPHKKALEAQAAKADAWKARVRELEAVLRYYADWTSWDRGKRARAALEGGT